MIGIVATLNIQDGKGVEFEPVFLELAAKVRANEPGNLLYQLVKSRTDANSYRVMELYTDQAAIDLHGKTDYFRELGRKMGAFMAGAPSVDYFDAVE